MKFHNFDKYVAEVEPWVEKLVEKIYDLLTECKLIKYDVKTINYDTYKNIEIQRKGIDILIIFEDVKCETKFRRYTYYDDNDILFETISVIEKNIPGWMYTCESDILLYCWWNKQKTNFMHRGYMILWKKLKETEWFKKLPNPDKYRLIETGSERNNQKWRTQFFCVPVKDFPKGILHIFDPSILIIGDSKQISLDDFFPN